MNNDKYQQLLKYLTKGEDKDRKYQKWAKQFREENGQIFKGKLRVLSQHQVTRVISIFHNLPTAAHQSKEVV